MTITKDISTLSRSSTEFSLIAGKMAEAIGCSTSSVTLNELQSIKLINPRNNFSTNPDRQFENLQMTIRATANGTSYTKTISLHVREDIKAAYTESKVNFRMITLEDAGSAWKATICRNGHGVGMSPVSYTHLPVVPPGA